MGRVVSVLEEIDADVVGLQEVGWHRPTHHRIDQFAYLRERTDYTVVEGLVRDPLRARFGNALLTRLPIEASRWIDRKSVVSGKSVSVRVDLGGRRIIKNKKIEKQYENNRKPN